MYFKLKKIDNECMFINGVTVHQAIDGSFIVFESEHDYKCYSYDNYKDWDKLYNPPVKSFSELYDLLNYIQEANKNE